MQVERFAALPGQEAHRRGRIVLVAKILQVIAEEHGQLQPILRAQPVAQLLSGGVGVDQLVVAEDKDRHGQRVDDRVEPDPGAWRSPASPVSSVPRPTLARAAHRSRLAVDRGPALGKHRRHFHERSREVERRLGQPIQEAVWSAESASSAARFWSS